MNGTKSHETKKDGQPLFNKDFGRLFCLFLQAGEEGLEPPFTVLETVALPLNYSPMACFIHVSSEHYESIAYLFLNCNSFL